MSRQSRVALAPAAEIERCLKGLLGVGADTLQSLVSEAADEGEQIVNQDEDVIVLILKAFGGIGCRPELVDHRGDHRHTIILQQLLEMLTGLCHARLFAAKVKGLPNLFVEINSVRNNHNSRILDLVIQG